MSVGRNQGRSKRYEESAGFTDPHQSNQPIEVSTAQSTDKYDVNTDDLNKQTDTLKIQIQIATESAKKLHRYQKTIWRKQQKHHSKELSSFQDKYSEELRSYYDAIEEIKQVAEGKRKGIQKSTSCRGRPNASNFDDFDGNCAACQRKSRDIMNLEKEKRRLSERVRAADNDLMQAIAQLDTQNADMRKQVEQEKKRFEHERREKEDALTRLSAVASSKLRDNNPNITDLSDQNRPTKIGEKLSELYDNEWTDAFDELENHMNNGEGIQTLLRILLDVFNACRELSTTSFFERVQMSIELPGSVNQKRSCTVVLPDQLKQQIKEFRKLRAPKMVNDVENVISTRIRVPHRDTEAMRNYFKGCVEVSWLSAVQDPPLVLNANAGEKFDTSVFRDYTSRGPYVEFVVWPALHLHENGPLLAKGVAQGCKGVVRHVTRQPALQQGHTQHKIQERHDSPGYKGSADQYHGRTQYQVFGKTNYRIDGEPDRYNQYPDRTNSRPLQNDTRYMAQTQHHTRQWEGQSGKVDMTRTQYRRPANETTF